MIFVTVGTQRGFDRLIRAVDQWGLVTDRHELFFQINNGEYIPKSGSWVRELSPDEFTKTIERADLTIAHAGIGTIITSLELSKPVIVLPRRAVYGEHRNDHQFYTARKLYEQNKVILVEDESDLDSLVNEVAMASSLGGRFTASTSPTLIKTINEFINHT